MDCWFFFRTTDEDGCCPGLIARPDFLPGLYKLRFETGPYWESLGHISFYPYVEVHFLDHCEILVCVFADEIILMILYRSCFWTWKWKESIFKWSFEATNSFSAHFALERSCCRNGTCHNSEEIDCWLVCRLHFSSERGKRSSTCLCCSVASPTAPTEAEEASRVRWLLSLQM